MVDSEELLAYFNAGIAVSALAFETPIHRISIDPTAEGQRSWPQLVTLKEYIAVMINRHDCIVSAGDYVTVLLSAPVGRAIGLECYFGLPRQNPEIRRMMQAYLEEARQTIDQLADRDDGAARSAAALGSAASVAPNTNGFES